MASSIPDGYRLKTNTASYKATQSNTPNSNGGVTVNNGGGGGGSTPSYRAPSFNYQRPEINYQDMLKQAQAQYDPLRQQTIKDIADQTQQARYQAGNMAAAQGVSHSGLAADQQNKLSIAQNDQTARANTQYDSQIAGLAQNLYQYQQSQAEQQYRDAYQQYLDNRNFGYQQNRDQIGDQRYQTQVDYNKAQDDRNYAIQQAQITDKYMSPEAQNTLNQLIALKQKAEQSANPSQYQSQGDALRGNLTAMGINNVNQLFGAGANSYQALQNYQSAYIPTAHKLQLDQNQKQNDVSNAWKEADGLGYVTPKLSQLTGLPVNTPTLQAKQIANNYNLQTQQLGISQQNADTASQKAQMTAGQPMKKTDDQTVGDWTSYFSKAAQDYKNGNGVSLQDMEKKIVSEAKSITDQGYPLDKVVDALYNAYSGGQFPTKKAYEAYAKDIKKQRDQYYKDNPVG